MSKGFGVLVSGLFRKKKIDAVHFTTRRVTRKKYRVIKATILAAKHRHKRLTGCDGRISEWVGGDLRCVSCGKTVGHIYV